MSEETKIVRKIKVKKPVGTSNQAPATHKITSIEDELADIDISFALKEAEKPAPVVIKASEPEKPENPFDEENDFDRLLREFIDSELDDIDIAVKEEKTAPPQQQQNTLYNPETLNPDDEEFFGFLKPEEKNLFRAYAGFINSVNSLCEKKGLEELIPSIDPEDLLPNYKPSRGALIAHDTVQGWELMFRAEPEQLANLNIASSDDDMLDFAEQCSDNDLTLAVISYVETLIEIESCELTYQEKSLLRRRKIIEREIYEEHKRRLERNKMFVAEIEKKRFPINAEKLIGNFFKTSQKDPDGAYKALTSNPAVFAPIEVDKIEPRFFGLIKPEPKDGIRINQKIAQFLKTFKS